VISSIPRNFVHDIIHDHRDPAAGRAACVRHPSLDELPTQLDRAGRPHAHAIVNGDVVRHAR
jgi:hypothetical protein